MDCPSDLHLYFTSSAVAIAAEVAGTCGGCGTQHYLFVNRGGHTRCLECDAKAKAKTMVAVIHDGRISLTQLKAAIASGISRTGGEIR